MRFPRKCRCIFTSVAILISTFDAIASEVSNPVNSDESRGNPSFLNTADYILQPFDLIKLEVFQEPDLERQVRISQESTVTLPLVGTVALKGKTVRQAQDLIRGLFDRDYLVNPQINLIVMEYAKHMVSVLGAVNTAGSVSIPPDQPLTLLDAIAAAGGFSRLADRRHIKLTRVEAGGKSITHDINADEIIKSTSQDTWTLKKDDVVFVPERVM